jgi:hypothetical protein
LEQVRNLLAVSAFYFLAEKTGSAILKALSTVTIMLFLNYLWNWQNTFSFRFLPYIKNERANFCVNLVLWLVVMLTVWLIGIGLIVEIIKAFAKLTVQ